MTLPKPYYDDGQITIYHADCRDVLPLLEPGSVDLVLTDPPYVGMAGGLEVSHAGVAPVSQPSKSIGDPWDASLDWFPDAWRVARLGALVFCSYHFVAELGMLVEPSQRVALLTWYKRNAPQNVRNVPRHTTELIWAFRKASGLDWKALRSTMLDIPNLSTGAFASRERITDENGRALHPTQKPLELTAMLMAIGGNTILDPFMGSGTTLRAAANLGRRAIGIEEKLEYCEIAVQRLAQQVLPLEATA